MISPWPDYMTKEVLARRISLKLGAIDQYVSRGLLPPPHKLGEALLWHWPEVDAAIQGRKSAEQHDDPYDIGAARASEAPATRQARPKQNGQTLPVSHAAPGHR